MARIPQDPFSPLSSSASIPSGGSLLDAPINPTRPVLQPHVPSPSSDMTSSLPPSATTTLSPTHGSATKHRSLSQLGRVSGATGRDGDGNGGAGGGDVRQLKLRLQYLEGILSRMQKEKAGMDEEFGRQRKKFMQQMVDLESEKNLAKQSITKHVSQIEKLNRSLAEKDAELSQLQATLNKGTASVREAYDADRVMYEEKIASLTKALKAASGETDTLGEELSTGKKTKKLRESKRSPSPLPDPADSLETSMIKAAQDTKLLKSVVVPLEEEIDMLRMQLKEAQERLAVYEGKPGDSLIDLFPTVPDLRQQQQDPGAFEQALVDKLLSQERAARHDLEMHIETLNNQKQRLTMENSSLNTQLEKVKEQLSMEQLSHGQLKQTWEQANLQFVSIHDKLKEEIRQLKGEDTTNPRIPVLVDIGTPSPEPRTLELPTGQGDGEGGTTTPLLGVVTTESRKRSASWNDVTKTGVEEDPQDAGVWRGVAEQLQKLVVQLRNDVVYKTKSCEEYEGQLQRVQAQLMLEIEGRETQMEKLREDINKLQATLIRERKSHQNLHRALLSEKEEMKTRVDHFLSVEKKMKEKMKGIKDKFTEAKHEVQRDMARFTEERVRLSEQLDQVREEYGCLKGVQASEITDYRDKLTQAELAQREAELNVAATMEELSKLQSSLNQCEEQYTTQISELQKQINRYQQEQDMTSSRLSNAESEIAELRRVHGTLLQEKETAVSTKNSIQEKSKRFIEDQRRQIEDLHKTKDTSEQTIHGLQRQVAALRQQLESSESVQKDFVELSQSLQVKLVQMEEQKQTDPPPNDDGGR